MTIIGHGIDAVDLVAFRRIVGDTESDFVDRCFTSHEKQQFSEFIERAEHLAGRFAAKEAIAKALGTGFSEEVTPLDIEITSLDSGAPVVALYGGAAKMVRSLGIVEWKISISHTPSVAIASAIASGT